MAIDDAAKAVKTVIVKGLGKIKFPASMADDEIAGIIQRHAQLDMSEPARMARAKSMGFDINSPLYHETSISNARLIEKNGFDYSFANARATDPSVPDGVFVKSSDKNLGLSFDPQQMSLYGNKGNQLVVKDRHELEKKILAYDEKYKPILDDIEKDEKYYESLFMDIDAKRAEIEKRLGVAANKNNEYIAINKKEAELIKDAKSKSKENAYKAREIINRYMDDNGYGTLKINVDSGSFGRETDSTIFRDVSRLRSSDAAFNPELAFSDNILASAAPAAVGLGLLSSLVSPESQASEQRAISRLAELGQSRPTGTIQAAQHPLLGRAANALLSFETPIDPLTGKQFQNTANLLQKFNYGDPRSYWDYFNANLDWM